MFYIACTRFTNATYKENIEYRETHNEQVIYGSAFKIRHIYPIGCLIFVAEMNNETNKIEGIGLIKNSLVSDKRYKIYENSDYNRYIYRGNYWINRDQLSILNQEILEIFDTILFKGKSHLKFRSGITFLTEKLFVHWIYELHILKNYIKIAFLTHFNKIKNDGEIEMGVINKVFMENELKDAGNKVFTENELKDAGNKVFMENELKDAKNKVFIENELKDAGNKVFMENELKDEETIEINPKKKKRKRKNTEIHI